MRALLTFLGFAPPSILRGQCTLPFFGSFFPGLRFWTSKKKSQRAKPYARPQKAALPSSHLELGWLVEFISKKICKKFLSTPAHHYHCLGGYMYYVHTYNFLSCILISCSSTKCLSIQYWTPLNLQACTYLTNANAQLIAMFSLF